MKAEIVDYLHRLNQEFYQSFSHSFSLTRQQIQPGVRRIIGRFRDGKNLLDIGCGNGNLAMELLGMGSTGKYLGIDFSGDLVQIAREKASMHHASGQMVLEFRTIDILHTGWIKNLPKKFWYS